MRFLAVILSTALLIFNAWIMPCAASSNPPDTLVDFFQSVTATVIMPIESGVLIDKGSADRIAPEDILSVVRTTTELRHPQTGKLLDIQTEYGEQLIVTKVNPHLSYCRFLGASGSLPAGTQVRRYANVPVYFSDPSGTGFSYFNSLRERLPHLLWKDYLTAAAFTGKSGLVIQYTPDRVTVINQNQQILFIQQMTMTASPTALANSAQEAAPGRPAAQSPVGLLSGGTVKGAPASSDARKWTTRRIDLSPSGEVEALRVSDMDQDGIPEILLTIDRTLYVYHLEREQLVELTRLATGGLEQIVDLSVLDIDGDGKQEVIVSAINDNRGEARIFKYIASKLVPVADVSMLLATFQPLKGDPILVGLENRSILDRDPQFFSVRLEGRQLVKTPCTLDGVQQPYGVASLAAADGARWLVSLSPEGHLRTRDRQGDIRWESSENYGGSTKSISVPQPGKQNVDDFKKYFFNSRLVKTDKGTLLVTQHDGPGLFGNNPTYNNGRMVELYWNGTTLEELAKTEGLGGMIVDFDQYDLVGGGTKNIIAAIIYRQAGFLQKPLSGLVILTPPR